MCATTTPCSSSSGGHRPMRRCSSWFVSSTARPRPCRSRKPASASSSGWAGWTEPAPLSGLHPQRFEVEIALHPAEDLVADRAALVEPQQRLALRVDHRAAHLAVLQELAL